MPSAGSGEMLGTWIVPNGEGIASPPPSLVRSGCRGTAWQDEHPAALDTTRPFAGAGCQAGNAVAVMTEGMVNHQNKACPAMPAIIRAKKILLNAPSVVVA